MSTGTVPIHPAHIATPIFFLEPCEMAQDHSLLACYRWKTKARPLKRLPVWHSGGWWAVAETQARHPELPLTPGGFGASHRAPCFPWSWHLSHKASISDHLLFPSCLDGELGEDRKPASLFTAAPQAFRNCVRRKEPDTGSQAPSLRLPHCMCPWQFIRQSSSIQC